MKKFTKALFIGVLLTLGFASCKNDAEKKDIFDGRVYIQEKEFKIHVYEFNDGLLYVGEKDKIVKEIIKYSVNGNQITLSLWGRINKDGITTTLDDYRPIFVQDLKKEEPSITEEQIKEAWQKKIEEMTSIVTFVEDGDKLIIIENVESSEPNIDVLIRQK